MSLWYEFRVRILLPIIVFLCEEFETPLPIYECKDETDFASSYIDTLLGVRHGSYSLYFGNQIVEEGNYHYGKLHGCYFGYIYNHPCYCKRYDNGSLIYESKYHKNGAMLEETFYHPVYLFSRYWDKKGNFLGHQEYNHDFVFNGIMNERYKNGSLKSYIVTSKCGHDIMRHYRKNGNLKKIVINRGIDVKIVEKYDIEGKIHTYEWYDCSKLKQRIVF